MLKKVHHSEKHFKCAGASLSLQIVLLVLTTSIPEGTGGSDDGDPAPGRSPGPPLQGYKPTEDAIKMSFGDMKKKSDEFVWCKNYFAPTSSPRVNLTLYNPLFGVFTKLLPGLMYHVSVRHVSNHETGGEIFAQSTSGGVPIGTWANRTSRRRCYDGDWTLIDPRETVQWTYHNVDVTNITFRFRSRMSPTGNFHEDLFSYSTAKDCTLKLRQTRGSFGSADLPQARTCRIIFPRKAPESVSEHKEGLLVELTRLNVPCTGGGFIQFVEETDNVHGEVFNSPRKLCGKLEELNLVERKLYFPSLSEKKKPFLVIHKNPVFSLNYHLVDYCYNVTFVSPNGSLVLNPVKNLLCHFRVHLPYGNRVLLRLQMGEDRLITTTENYNENAQNIDLLGRLKLSSSNYSIQNALKRLGNGQNSADATPAWTEKDGACDGLFVIVWDGRLTWNHCSRHGDPKRDIQVSSRENVVTIKIVATTGPASTTATTATVAAPAPASSSDAPGYPVVKFWYHAEPVTEIVGTCDFGEVLVKQFCVSANQVQLDWDSAEKFCGKRGGHLASIRDETSQNVIDNLLINSPEYREHSSYWIGASDKIYEGYFRWSDGFAFSYSNWFPGWSQQGFYNRQPNDDGFSHQDCVEIRRVFPHPSGSRIIDGTTSSYLWNDLDCAAKNFFLCERLESGETSEQSWNQECNRTITLTREHPKATVVSFGFPHQYPDNVHCETTVTAPSGFRLIIDFEELVIEKEPSCSYDYLELIEDSWNESFVARRLCDDMSDKLKLLRYISQGPRLKFLFVSDYSHHYSGFKARVSIESAGMECSDERYEMFNNSCYLFVSYPKVTWETASQICRGVKAELASIQNPEEESFITGNIRNSIEYATSSAYWLGGYLDGSDGWKWTDGSVMEFTAWPPREHYNTFARKDENCLAAQWVSLKTESSHSSSGLYWTPKGCNEIGGYVCKKGNQVSGEMGNFNRTLNGTEGHFTSPGYPNHYYNNLDYYVRAVGPVWTRMVIAFSTIDLENQAECLYDYIEIQSGDSQEPQVRWCGNKTSKKNRSIFVSNNNEAIIRFHSDYSVSGGGFHASWKAVDISGCPSQKLTAREGVITSPNYGDFLLPRLDCTTIIIAPPGKRIWIEFEEIDFGEEKRSKETVLEINLGGNHVPFQLFQLDENLENGNFISEGEKMVIRLKTSKEANGNGFRAVYRTVGTVHEEKIVNLSAKSGGVLHHLNYPAEPPPNVSFIQHLIAPLGHVIHVELHQVSLSDTGKTCPGGNGIIEVTDNYADENGTWWFLCESKMDSTFSSSSSLAITSYLNTLHIRQTNAAVGARMNATVKVKQDTNYKEKLLKVSDGGLVESCRPNPCQNGGKCLTSNAKKMCQCIGHYTGMFCALTQCELEPCLFGQCELTGSGYKCHCQSGYTGLTCERKQSPCEDNPCEGRGECMEKSDSFHCRCHAWWEGPRCEKRMMHIPFKPLSERMLQEPFWLGLITVFVVLGVIGLVWCAKRHFPEKLEKLLAEEADRNHRTNVSGLIRPPSIREPVAASGTVPVTNPSGSGNVPRRLFGRLGIRKSSLLSLTSPQRPDRATSRTFSLDDLLRPTPRRTPSPRKKPNSSAPPKRNAAEKKQILQHLICPTMLQPSSEKSSPVEPPIVLQEAKRKSLPSERTEWQETNFCSPTVKISAKTDFGKLEKKVTFAKLLNKVSAEMSSSSEPETSNLVQLQAFSTPVSPALERLPLERRFSHSVYSNQGSDSLSSSEIAISGSAFNSLLDIPNNVRRPSKGTGYRISKIPSSDFVLDMFRNFSSTSVVGRGREVTPSSTPSASSPQDEMMISDESSIFDTPISTTSGPFDSPCDVLVHGTTIEIPVMDVLTAQKTAHNHQPPSVLLEIPSTGNKYLSPIRELPTPMPSPALTPIMSRIDVSSVKKSASDSSDDEVKMRACNEDDESENFSEALIQVHREDDDDDDLLSPTDEEFTQTNFLSTNQDSISQPIMNQRTGMIIPLLTVQEPSPPSTSPPGSYPGSPPPQKDTQPFIYSPVGSPRRLLKGPDKPNSLELPYPPPMITITCNVSEPESDTEFLSPAPKGKNLGSLNPTVNSVGMTYLSPFSMCSRGDRTASESNLSSSGYSSMASPGPSRCGSNNPLCLSEVEDQQHSQGQSPTRFPQARTPNNCDQRSDESKHRGRSDSETLSDDPLLESNDEGIGTDHVDEKPEDKEVKNLRDVEVFTGKEVSNQNVVNFGSLLIPNSQSRGALKKWDNSECMTGISPVIPKASLQLPTIVVQSDHCDKLLSPVSSRSESPLSDKALNLGRFSPMFYNKSKCDNLPFTDSDGLYDFPSSDCPPSNNKSVQAGTTSHRKSTGRRRERRNSHRTTNPGSKTSSPTKGPNALLEVPPKETPGHRITAQRKPSPKRRVRTQHPLSSSSSTESLTSRKFVSLKAIDDDNLRSKTECAKTPDSNENSSEEITEGSCKESKESSKDERPPTKRAIGFRTIGHQIRFLRRIELSLKRKEKLISCVDTEDDDDDDDEEDIEDPSLSLLPQRELQKTNGIGLLPQNVIPKRRIKKRNYTGLVLPRPPAPKDGLSITHHGQTD